MVADISECTQRDVLVVACSENGNSNHHEGRLRVVRAKSWGTVASLPISPRYILSAIREMDGQIIHAHHPNPLASIALFIASIAGKDISRTIVHWHSDVVKQRGALILYRPLMNWMLRKAKVIVVTSDRYLIGSLQLRSFRDKAVVVPIGTGSLADDVDPVIVSRIRDRYAGKKIVFSLGRHIYYKGFECLIDSAQKLDGAVILIGGAGPDTESYQRRIDQLGLHERVILLGTVPQAELPSYYSAADVFCLPSTEKSEAYGVVQLEAMSVGTPVVSTDIEGSGVSWVNAHGVSGLVCRPHDKQSLALAIAQLLEDEALRMSLGRGARSRFESLFTREAMADRMEAIYRTLDR